MIYFITAQARIFDDFSITCVQTLDIIHQLFNKSTIIALDSETTGLT